MGKRVRLADLKTCEIPEGSGVYWVVVPDGMDIKFNPPVGETLVRYQAETLQRIYEKNGSSTLYIGKAGGKGGLRRRLRQYWNTLFMGGKSHRGGRAIGQVEHFENLYFEFMECENCEARETELLKKFKADHGSYPVANHRG